MRRKSAIPAEPTDRYTHLTRGTAAKLIDHVRKLLASRVSSEKIEEVLRETYDVLPLEKCTGEAHQNGHQDGCVVCSPRWGYTGPEVTVR
jgi:hypothetical protein